MNFYIVVEGGSEKRVYKDWIKHINSTLTFIEHISEFQENNYYIVDGHGTPYYFDVIDNAILDVNALGNVSRLVIGVDSENMTLEEKLLELQNHIADKPCSCEIRIVIQHFCLETWALANRRIIGGGIRDAKLASFVEYFNVAQRDPELMPPFLPYYPTRSGFAYSYLRRAINEKHPALSYSKRDPHAICDLGYFTNIKRRLNETVHIQSFHAFIDAFT